MKPGFLWTMPDGSSRRLVLRRPLRVLPGSRQTVKTSYRTVSLDQRTVVTEDLAGGAEMLTAEIRFVGAPNTLLDFLDAGRAGRLLRYRPNIDLPWDEYPAVFDPHGAVQTVSPDPARGGFHEWAVQVRLRLIDGTDWSLWSQHGVPNLLRGVREAAGEGIFAIGSVLEEDSAWPASASQGGAVLGYDGIVYGIPLSGTSIMRIDPRTQEVTWSTYGLSMGGGSKWTGGAMAPNGVIYGCPYSSPDVLRLDPATQTATRPDYGLSGMSDTGKWGGAVCAPNGKIYCVPHTAVDWLVIDPVAETAIRTDFGTTLAATSSKWYGAVLAPNGKIYGIPFGATQVIVLDPDTETVSFIGTGVGGRVGGVLGPDGKIYGVPLSANTILIIDPQTGVVTTSAMGADLTGSNKWWGGALGPDGRIYCGPRQADDILIIDPMTQTALRSTLGIPQDTFWAAQDSKFFGTIAAPGGHVYFVPWVLRGIGHVTVEGPGIPRSVLLSPHLNKTF